MSIAISWRRTLPRAAGRALAGGQRAHGLEQLHDAAVPALALGGPAALAGELRSVLRHGPAELAHEAFRIVVEVDQGLAPALRLRQPAGHHRQAGGEGLVELD